jgi:2'-5' RNA ligase
MKAATEIRSGYTHFVGVLVPERLADIVEDCRSWMTEYFGCKSGYRTAPHITLVAPFALSVDPDAIRSLKAALYGWAKTAKPFEASVTGFGAFAERTVYAHVDEHPSWLEWHAGVTLALKESLPRAIPPKQEKFTPHLTVANRDIPPGGVPLALVHFAELGMHEKFTVNNAALFVWRNGAWFIDEVVEVGP